MIPLRDVIPTRTTPWITFGLMGGMAALFAIDRAIARGFTLPAAASTVLRIFAHADALHLASTLLVLWLFGRTLEDRLGHVRYFAFYVTTGALAAAACAAAGAPDAAKAAGASGAAAAIVGGYLARYPTSRILVLVYLVAFVDVVEIPALLVLVVWLLLQLVSSVMQAPGIAPGATALLPQAAGLAAGAALIWLFRQKRRDAVAWWG